VMTHATAEPALDTVEQGIATRQTSALPMTITGIETVALRIPYKPAARYNPNPVGPAS
jgi:hypothetical protein